MESRKEKANHDLFLNSPGKSSKERNGSDIQNMERYGKN